MIPAGQPPNRGEVIMRKAIVLFFLCGLLASSLLPSGVFLSCVELSAQTRDAAQQSENNDETGKTLFPESSVPDYRRIFFPQYEIAKMPMQGRYPPISAEWFHRRMDMLQRSGNLNAEFENLRFLKSLNLTARLEGKQLVAGKGVMQIETFGSQSPANQPDDGEHAIGWPIVLSPFRLAVSNPYWSDGMPGQLGLVAGEKTVLYAPSTKSELRFDWTLRGESDSQSNLFFVFELPRFLQIRLFLDLPEDKKPIVSSAIVQPEDAANVPEGFRRWQIAFNGSQPLRVIIASDESREKYHQTIGVGEHHSYDISLYRVQLNSLFFLEKSEFVLPGLLIELDKPLSPLAVKSGDHILSWTDVSTENDNVTRLLVSVPSMENGIRRLQVESFCATQIDQLWELPKIRICSPLFFWNETRNIVHVNRPLLTQRLVTPDLRQDIPESNVDQSESDLFVFQAFSENSTINIELGMIQPHLLMQSGTVFQWGERELTARAVLDISVEEGEVSELALDVGAEWTVDLIEAADSTRVVNYFVDDADHDESSTVARWAVTLRHPVVPSQPIRLAVQLRRPLSSEEQSINSDPTHGNRYTLADFVPVRVLDSRQGTQLIAFNTERRYRLNIPHGKDEKTFFASREQIRERFDGATFGNVLAYTPAQEDTAIEFETLKPTYSVTSTTQLLIQKGMLTETCRFHCVPDENSRMNQLIVHFSRHDQPGETSAWSWTLGEGPESSQQIKAIQLNRPKNDVSAIDETWVLDLTPSRSTPFVITATRSIPFEGETLVPLPLFPDVSNADAWVTLETIDATMYRITQNPAQAASGGGAPDTPSNQTNGRTSRVNSESLRAIYRYGANDRTLLSKDAVFAMEPTPIESFHAASSTDSTFSGTTASSRTGNVWELALHSHFHPHGEVVSYAIMTLENRAMNQLAVSFPSGVKAENIRNIWIDNAKVDWAVRSQEQGGFDLLIDIPVRERFLSVMIEYVCFQTGKDFSPSLPTLQIPVFVQKWYAWHSPNERGYIESSRQDAGQTLQHSHGMGIPANSTISMMFPNTHREEKTGFDLFMSSLWLDGRIPPKTEKRLIAGSRQLVDLLSDRNLLRSVKQGVSRDAAAKNASPETVVTNDDAMLVSLQWRELFSSEIFQTAVSGHSPSQDSQSQNMSPAYNGRRRVFIDHASLSQWGIFSEGFVFSPESHSQNGSLRITDATLTPDLFGLAVLERNGLALIFDKHNNLLITTTLTAGKLRTQLVPIYSNHFWYVSTGNIGEWNVARPNIFMSPALWQNVSVEAKKSHWFSDTSQQVRACHPGWVVHEITHRNDLPVSIRLVHGDKMAHFQLCLFFAVLVVSWRLPLNSMTWLVVAVVIALIMTVCLSPFWIPFAYSVFWGGICAITFGLIRYFHANRREKPSLSAAFLEEETTIAAILPHSDDSESGEVRHPFTFTVSESAKKTEPLSGTPIDPESDSHASKKKTKPDDSSDDSGNGLGRLLSCLLAAISLGIMLAGSNFVMAQSTTSPEASTSFPLGPSPGTLPGGTLPDMSPGSYFPTTDQSFSFAKNVRDILESRTPDDSYQIFIPCDREGRPGNLYYIPENLYLLLMQTDQGANHSGNWQIRSARYTGTLKQDPLQSEVTLFNLRVVFEIELFDRSARIRLPEMPLRPDGVFCDNQLIQPTIEQVGQGAAMKNEYVFAISGQGRHLLELVLLPGVYDDPDALLRHFSFSIPRVADSSFELKLPHAYLPVNVLPALGQVTQIGTQWKAELGPVDRLSVSWQARSSNQQNCSVSQYFRLAVESNRIRLQTRYRFNVSGGSIRHVLLNVDPRYRRDGDYRVSAEVESIDTISSTSQVRITLRNPVTDTLIVDADYIPRNISGTGNFSGIGTLPLPEFSATDMRINCSWLGVSVDPSTQIELPVSTVETKMFENAWGMSDLSVHFAFDLLRPMEDSWFLSARNRPLIRQVDQRQWLLFRDQSILVHIEADVTPGYESDSFGEASGFIPAGDTTPVFRHDMLLPEGFRIDSIELKGTDSQPVESPRLEQNGRQIALFFEKPLFGKYTVSMSGTLDVESATEIAFPLFEHEERDVVSYSVFCYRDFSVMTDLVLQDTSVQKVEVIPHPESDFSESKFLSSFLITSPEEFSKSTVKIHPNRPKITGNMISFLESNYQNQWVIWDISVTQGALDQVSIFLPVQTDSIAVFPEGIPSRQIQKADGTLLQLNPREQMTGDLYFWIRFPINGEMDVVSVPSVVFQHEHALNQYVALPDHASFRPLNWSLNNLVPADFTLKSKAKEPEKDPVSNLLSHANETHKYYKVTRDDFSARTNFAEENAFISCHDVTCFLKKDGFYLGVSKFDIHANGAPYCDFRLPETHQLIQLRLNNVYPMPQQLDERTFRVELLSDVPAQRLALVFCSRDDRETPHDDTSFLGRTKKNELRHVQLDFPQILSLPVQKTLWELYMEQSSATAEQLDLDLNLWNGRNFLEVRQENMLSLARENAGDIQARMSMIRLHQQLAHFRMMSSQNRKTQYPYDWQPSWNRRWTKTQSHAQKYMDSVQKSDQDWRQAFALSNNMEKLSPEDDYQRREDRQFHDEWKAMAEFVEHCLETDVSLNTIQTEINTQYVSTSGNANVTEESADNSTTFDERDEEHDYFMTHFWSDGEHVGLVSGVAPYCLTGQTLTIHKAKESFFRGMVFTYLVWGTLFAVVLFLAITRRTRQIFKRFSSLFVIALITFCWLFLSPNLLGWTVLLILFVIAVRVQWNQMRLATDAVRHDNSTINPNTP